MNVPVCECRTAGCPLALCRDVTWPSTLFQSEQWAPRVQPETALQGTVSNMAV